MKIIPNPMVDIFYYIGIGYIIYLLDGIRNTIFDKSKKGDKLIQEMKNGAPKDLTEVSMQSIPDIVQPLANQAKNDKLSMIISLLFFAWILIGAWRPEEDSIYFTFIIIQILSYQVFVTINMVINAFNEKNEFIITSLLGEASKAMKSKTITIIHIILEIFKLTIVSFVLYNYFSI